MHYELTDREWAAIKPMLPNKPRGVPRVNDRLVLNGIFWVLRSGAPWANIPPKSSRSEPICFSPYLYRSRNRVERFFNRIKQCRRVATRYDKLAANYLAFVQLASIRLWRGFDPSASPMSLFQQINCGMTAGSAFCFLRATNLHAAGCTSFIFV
ncbi:transposase [Bradyrhizobium sp. LM2.7]